MQWAQDAIRSGAIASTEQLNQGLACKVDREEMERKLREEREEMDGKRKAHKEEMDRKHSEEKAEAKRVRDKVELLEAFIGQMHPNLQFPGATFGKENKENMRP